METSGGGFFKSLLRLRCYRKQGCAKQYSDKSILIDKNIE